MACIIAHAAACPALWASRGWNLSRATSTESAGPHSDTSTMSQGTPRKFSEKIAIMERKQNEVCARLFLEDLGDAGRRCVLTSYARSSSDHIE